MLLCWYFISQSISNQKKHYFGVNYHYNMKDKIKLLIVEDDPIIATDLERAMVKMGYAVLDSLESGEEALELIKKEVPDLILMDIQLEGDLDGIDTSHMISKQHQIPIIFLTSNTDMATFNRAKLTQPHGFLSKPFRYTDIANSIALAFIDKNPSPGNSLMSY